jgi:MFS family permease
MISLMNMASIHVHHEAGSLAAVGMVIAVHTAGMYLPGPLVGYLTDRFGPHPVLVTGLGLEVAAAVLLALVPGHDVVLVGSGLLLLGAGWSAAYLSASVLLTASTEGPTRTLAQGAADFLVQLTAAGGALLAGVVVALWGYGGLSSGWAVVMVVLLVAVVTRARQRAETTETTETPG